MKRLSLLLLVAACATETPARKVSKPLDVKLVHMRGKTLSVVVLDTRKHDERLAKATRGGVERLLRENGVTVVDDAPTRLVLEFVAPETAHTTYTPECARIVAHLEAVAQAYLPSQSATAERCTGPELSGGSADEVGVIFEAIKLGVTAADGRLAADIDQRQLQALSETLAEVLSQLDAMAR